MNTIQKNKYLLKNTTIFAIGNLGTKVINFFLVPLYTGVLTTNEYGITDLIYTILTIVSPIVMLSMGEAILRFSLDRDADYRNILSVSFFTIAIGVLVSIIVIPITSRVSVLSDYSIYIYLYLIMMASNSLLLCYLRGREKLVMFTICNLMTTICIAFFNILFLVVNHFGIKGFLSAYIISYLISNILAIILGKQYKVIFHFKFPKILWKEMAFFSIALIPNSLMWWITNSSDRLMLTAIVGVAANGIYAVSTKLPSLISAISDVFLKAWSYSAVKEYEDKNGVEYSNVVYKQMFKTLCIIGALLLVIVKPFTYLYVPPEYYTAWRYSPWLIVGSIFTCLATFIGTPYFVHKDSKANMLSGMFGAVINVVLNFLLIPRLGIMGAAISTCVSYISVLIYRILDTRKYLRLEIMNKHYFVSIAIVCAMLAIEYIDNYWGFLFLIILSVCEIVLNHDIIVSSCKMVVRLAKNMRKNSVL